MRCEVCGVWCNVCGVGHGARGVRLRLRRKAGEAEQEGSMVGHQHVEFLVTGRG